MHFLNGSRIYLKPVMQCLSPELQLADCLLQLEHFSSDKKIYKLNFFAGLDSVTEYHLFKHTLEQQLADKFQFPILLNVIAQAPLTCRLLVEVFYFDESLWHHELLFTENGSAIAFEREGARVLIGQVQAAGDDACSTNASAAFRSMNELLAGSGFKLHTVIRQWNYIERILGFDENRQRYQEFNNVRSEFYGSHFNETGFPAATGIGIKYGGVIIEFIAVKAAEAINKPLNNQEQVAAHEYSSEVLAGEMNHHKSTPKFERARYFELFGQKQLFISGTASIRGEKTTGRGNPEEQTRITIENIQHLYSGSMLKLLTPEPVKPSYGHARVYLKNREDFRVVKKTFKAYYGSLPVVYLIADICRDDLLVEIEGKVILEKE
jgi:hypothetical protein